MEAIIGRYRVQLQEEGTLALTHPAGIAFDLTAEEVLELFDFIGVYRKTLMTFLRETDTELKRIVKVEAEQTGKAPLIEDAEQDNP